MVIIHQWRSCVSVSLLYKKHHTVQRIKCSVWQFRVKTMLAELNLTNVIEDIIPGTPDLRLAEQTGMRKLRQKLSNL